MLAFASLLYVFIGYKVFYLLQMMLMWALPSEFTLHSMPQSFLNMNGKPTEVT